MKFKKTKRRFPQGKIVSWILFSVALLVIFGGLFAYQAQKEKGLTTQEKTEESKGTRKPFAMESLTEAEKAKMDRETLHEAWSKNDPEACEAMLNPAEKERCLDQIHYALYIKGNDETQCETLYNPTLKQQCIDKIVLRIALEELNIERCEKIQEPAKKQDCSERIQSIIGIRQKSMESCETLRSASLKNQCRDEVRYAKGIEKNDAEECQTIENNALRGRCEATVTQNQRILALNQNTTIKTFGTQKNQLDNCDEWEGEKLINCQDKTNLALALEKQDLTFCQKIQDRDRQNECLQVQGGHLNRFYLEQALAKKDKGFCSKILEETLRSACLQYLP